MDMLLIRKTKSGEVKREIYKRIDKAIFFDDVKARIQVDNDCCVRVPVKPKDQLDNAVEIK